jgi:hypothetical protein
MKLAAIYNVWDGVELLNGSMESVADGVDLFIIVFQNVSNTGEIYDPRPFMNLNIKWLNEKKVITREYKPEIGIYNNPGQHERNKRNIGLDIARENGCSHFLHLDCDEYYLNFKAMKKAFLESGAAGSACKIYTYFKEPTLRLMNHDNYFVPFIHQLNENTICGKSVYPHYVDPTRKINVAGHVPIIGDMHHFSWIRNDINRKIRNSTARVNIEKSDLLKIFWILEQLPELN